MASQEAGVAPVIIDGDKQFGLIMVYIKALLNRLGLNEFSHVLVNTAYCNSKANQYLDANTVNNVCVPTGVKNAHPEVVKYTIGANDEPNGHGTVCVKWDELNKVLKGKEDQLEA